MDFASSAAAEIWLPMAASILTGAAIGFEREFKAKAAGVRTHALVCFSAAILMMAGVRQADWVFAALPGTQVVSDPTRMAHGILTGIGFLGAGVIFKQGNGVKGLTTAASVWVTASLGVLYGAGLTMLAAAGTVTALVVLVIFRLFHVFIPDRIELRVDVICAAGVDPEAVAAAMARHARRTGPVAWRRRAGAEGGHLRVCGRVWLRRSADVRELDRALQEVPGVTEISVVPIVEVERLNW
jgi:putative Mg2+ transporter-C (MgtC) family protein